MTPSPFELADDDSDSEEMTISDLTNDLGLRVKMPNGEDPFVLDEDDQAVLGPVRTEGDDLCVVLLLSPHPAATIVRKEGAEAREIEGVEAVLFAEDLGPEMNRILPWRPNDPVLADDTVLYCGQPVAIIVGKNAAACREAKEKIHIQYHTAPGILTIDHAEAMQSFHGEKRSITRGDAASVIKGTAHESVFEGTFEIASQLAGGRPPGVRINFRPGERAITVEVRTESPSRVRAAVAAAFELPESEVAVSALPLENSGTASGMEAVLLSVIAAFAAARCRWSVGLQLSADEAALLLGRRHAAKSTFKVAHDSSGQILAADIRIALDSGYSVGDSETVIDRALLHADSAYFIPDFAVHGQLCKTHSVSSANFPAEGAAQGIWTMEEIMSRLAVHLNLSVEKLRKANFYNDKQTNNSTHYGQPVNGAAIDRVWKQARRRSRYDERVADLAAWNRQNASFKRGIGITPMKVGIGDPRSDRNHATAQVQVMHDGSIRVHPGIVDVFDGLTAQIQKDVATSFSIPVGKISVFTGNPETTPHMTARMGVDTTGLVLRAVSAACTQLQDRLREVALQMLAAQGKVEIELEAIEFQDGRVGVGTEETGRSLTIAQVIAGAFRRRVNLTEIGYFRAPNLWWDREVGAGWPFSGFAYGAAVAEVQIDAFTGEIDIMRVDLVHEGGPAPDQSDRDEAQLIRAFAQGQGWLLSEPQHPSDEDDPRAALTTGCAGIPGLSDAPIQISVDRLRPMGELATTPGAPCTEAPVVLAMAIREAVRNAISAFSVRGNEVPIDFPIPATPPEILRCLRAVSRKPPEV